MPKTTKKDVPGKKAGRRNPKRGRKTRSLSTVYRRKEGEEIGETLPHGKRGENDGRNRMQEKKAPAEKKGRAVDTIFPAKKERGPRVLDVIDARKKKKRGGGGVGR